MFSPPAQGFDRLAASVLGCAVYRIQSTLHPEKAGSGCNPLGLDGTILSPPRVGRKKRGQPSALRCSRFAAVSCLTLDS